MCLSSEYPGDNFLWRTTRLSPAESKNVGPQIGCFSLWPALIGCKGSHLSFIDMANRQNGPTHTLLERMKSTREYRNPSSDREERI